MLIKTPKYKHNQLEHAGETACAGGKVKLYVTPPQIMNSPPSEVSHISVGLVLLPDPQVLTGLHRGFPYTCLLAHPKPPHLPACLFPELFAMTCTSGILVDIRSVICNGMCLKTQNIPSSFLSLWLDVLRVNIRDII